MCPLFLNQDIVPLLASLVPSAACPLTLCARTPLPAAICPLRARQDVGNRHSRIQKESRLPNEVNVVYATIPLQLAPPWPRRGKAHRYFYTSPRFHIWPLKSAYQSPA